MKNLITKTPFLSTLNLSIIKKMLCIFLIYVMFFNGFVPKSQEAKSNFFSALNCAVHAAFFEVFSRCNDTVAVMSNKIAHELFLLFSAETGTAKPMQQEEDNNQQPVPVNTSADSAITTQRTVSEQMQFSLVKTTVVYISYIAISKLYRLYNNVKVDPSDLSATMLFMLLIILFGIYTIRIKDVINYNILKNNIGERNRLA